MARRPPLRPDRRIPRAERLPAGVLILLAALALAAAGCGGDDGGDPVEGEGYSYSTPDGWDDVTDDAQDEEELEFFGVRPDTLVTGDSEDGFATNVNVVTQGGVPPNVTTRQFADVNMATLRSPAQAGMPLEIARSIEALNVRDITTPEDAQLGGEEAVAFEYLTTQRGRDLRIRQLVAVMDGSGYTVTLTAVPGDQFDEGREALDGVADSWEWE
jgi:hypothetical protein